MYQSRRYTMIKYYVWPDESYCSEDEYEYVLYSYMSDDYVSVDIPDDVEEDSDEFYKYIKEAVAWPK